MSVDAAPANALPVFLDSSARSLGNHTNHALGTEVRLVNLRLLSQFNGFRATVVGWNEATKSWRVSTGQGAETREFLPNNVELWSDDNVRLGLCKGVRVTVLGAEPNAEARGTGVLFDYIDKGAEGPMWNVAMDGEPRRGLCVRREFVEPVANVFKIGERVRMKGFKDKELNGITGAILEWQPGPKKWAVVVDVEEGPKGRIVSPRNLEADASKEFDPGQAVKITGLEQRYALNGQVCEVVEYAEVEKCWRVRFSDGEIKLVPRANMEPQNSEANGLAKPAGFASAPPAAGGERSRAPGFWPGRLVRLQGLKEHAAKNGLEATLVEPDGTSPSGERWKVRMLDGIGFSVSPAHLALSGPAPLEPGVPLVPGQTCRISRLQTRQELNGAQCVLVSWDAGRQRWLTRDGAGHQRSLKEAYLDPDTASFSVEQVADAD